MATLPQLTWVQGDLHTYTNDLAGDIHPTASLLALSASIVSSSNWQVGSFAITGASSSYPHLIVSPTSTSSSYKDMRILFVTGLAANATDGPASADMATNAGTLHTSYDPCLYIGIAPFAGQAAAPNQICTGSSATGDWRKAGTKGDIWPASAKFSGFHVLMGARVSSNQLEGGTGGLYLIENEEMLFVSMSENWESHVEESVTLGGGGALFVPYATSSAYGDPGRLFGLAGGQQLAAYDYTTLGRSNTSGFDLAGGTQTDHWPGNYAASNTYGHRHYAYDYGNGSWVQLSTMKFMHDDIDLRDFGTPNHFRDNDGNQILLPLHVHQAASPYTAMGYWRQMTQCARIYGRSVMRGASGSIKGYGWFTSTWHDGTAQYRNPGYFFHNDKSTT